MSYQPILLERLLERNRRDTYRGHMPGHKGKPMLPAAVESIDFTELCDTGNLYDPQPNIIRDAEAGVAAALGAEACVYCAGGSTLLIQGALAAVASAVGRPPKILAARDAHRSFFSAMALLGGEAEYIYPKYRADGIAAGVDENELAERLEVGDFDAVYVTAPNYYGSYCNVSALGAVCAAKGVPLIVDAAHAAHLVCEHGFSGEGNCVAVFSAHKTLGALGGAAFALTSGTFFDKNRLLSGMQLFGSSSPSYAILASLDLALSRAIGDDGRDELRRVSERAAAMRRRLAANGVLLPGEAGDPLRLVVGFADKDGQRINGSAAADWMERQHGVACEMADERWVVFILTAADSVDDLARLERAIIDCAGAGLEGAADGDGHIEPPVAERVMSLREAYFSPWETVPLRDAAGRIAAEIVAPYPPGVPVVAPGEKITQKVLSFLGKKWYNIDRGVRVVRTADYPGGGIL